MTVDRIPPLQRHILAVFLFLETLFRRDPHEPQGANQICDGLLGLVGYRAWVSRAMNSSEVSKDYKTKICIA